MHCNRQTYRHMQNRQTMARRAGGQKHIDFGRLRWLHMVAVHS